MILDNIRNLKNYAALDSRFEKVLAFIEGYDKNPLPAGKHEIDGKSLFVNIIDADNGPDEAKKYEIHHLYADLQYMYEGGQRIWWKDALGMTPDGEFNTEKDVGKLVNVDGGIPCDLKTGEFLLVYPEDAHRPDCVHPDFPHAKKFVFKLRVEDRA